MKTPENKFDCVVSAFVLASFAVVLATACSSSDDNPAPGTIVGDSAIPTTDTAKDTATPIDGITPVDTAVDSPVGETIADAADAKPWDPDSGLCFPGDPTTDQQFLDKCTSATCIPYDNSKLAKLGAGGALPPLP